MRIPFLDLSRQHKQLNAELMEACERVVSSSVFCLGPEVEAFEQEWSSYCGVAAAAGVGSGTDALALALLASGAVKKGRGDEVVVPALSAGYTAIAALSAGAVPVFTDVHPQTHTLDPDAIEKTITPRTRAIVPVHLYGQIADIAAIADVARRHSLVVIEDAAQAHGARVNGRAAGVFGDAGIFSFYPTKNLGGCGDGGAVVSNDPDVIENVKTLRQGGHLQALGGEIEGRNSRLDELQAAILRVKLKRLEDWNYKRRQLAGTYQKLLQPLERVRVPVVNDVESHVFHLYVIEHPERDALRLFLAERGIETLIHYPFLLHQQKLFRSMQQRSLPAAESVVGRLLSLPLYPQLLETEVETVANAIVEFEHR